MLCARLCACFPVKQRGVLSCRVTRARTSAGADRRSTRSGYVGWCGCVWAGGQATQRCTARATRRPPTWRATVLALSTWSASARGLSPLARSALSALSPLALSPCRPRPHTRAQAWQRSCHSSHLAWSSPHALSLLSPCRLPPVLVCRQLVLRVGVSVWVEKRAVRQEWYALERLRGHGGSRGGAVGGGRRSGSR